MVKRCLDAINILNALSCVAEIFLIEDIFGSQCGGGCGGLTVTLVLHKIYW